MKKLHHIGVLTHDIAKTVEYYNTLYGDVQWSYDERCHFPQECLDVGNEFVIKSAHGDVGDFVIELIEPLDGERSYLWIAANEREGLHHIAYMYDNEPERQTDIARLVEKGFTIVHAAERLPGHGTHYLVAPNNSVVFELKC